MPFNKNLTFAPTNTSTTRPITTALFISATASVAIPSRPIHQKRMKVSPMVSKHHNERGIITTHSTSIPSNGNLSNRTRIHKVQQPASTKRNLTNYFSNLTMSISGNSTHSPLCKTTDSNPASPKTLTRKERRAAERLSIKYNQSNKHNPPGSSCNYSTPDFVKSSNITTYNLTQLQQPSKVKSQSADAITNTKIPDVTKCSNISRSNQTLLNEQSTKVPNHREPTQTRSVHQELRLTSAGNRLQNYFTPKKLFAGLALFTGARIFFWDKVTNLLSQLSEQLSFQPNIPSTSKSLDNATIIEIYIDPASVGPTNHLIDILESQSTNRIGATYRLASWGRLKPSEESCKALGIEYFALLGNIITKSMLTKIQQIALQHGKVKLNISCNTAWSYNTLMDLVDLTLKNSNITINSIVLYEDGTWDCTKLATQTLNQKQHDLISKQLKDYVLGWSPNRPPNDLYTLYSWQSAFHRVSLKALRQECFSSFNGTAYLKEFLGSALSEIQWTKFSSLSSKQQNIFLNAVGFNKTELQRQYDLSPNPNIVFTGTTTWGGSKIAIARQQMKIIKGITNKQSQFFLSPQVDLFYKGHPAGGIINQQILNHFNKTITALPDKLSFEVLMMTNMLPDKVCGMPGSVYFSIPQEKIGFIVFNLTGRKVTTKQMLADPLVNAMLKLKVITLNNIIY